MKLERMKLESSGWSWKGRTEVEKNNWSWKVTDEVEKIWFNLEINEVRKLLWKLKRLIEDWTFRFQKKISNFARFFLTSLGFYNFAWTLLISLDSFQLEQKLSNFRLSNLTLSNFSVSPTTRIWEPIGDFNIGDFDVVNKWKTLILNVFQYCFNSRLFISNLLLKQWRYKVFLNII